jgi:hypothetical protein
MRRANDRLASVLADRLGTHIDSYECRHPTFDVLNAESIRSPILAACRVPFRELVQLGIDSPHKFRILGYDCLNLLEGEFLGQITSEFGANGVRDAFVISAGDAVAVAGTDVQDVLQLSLCDLLLRCNGSPLQGRSVVEATMARYKRGVTAVGGIRVASPLVGCTEALLNAGVSLALCEHVEGAAWLDVETDGLTIEQRFKLGLPVLRLGRLEGR